MEIESRIFEEFPMNPTTSEPIGFARVEWTKGYAYTEKMGWSNEKVMKEIIPNSYPREEWNYAIGTWDTLDPHKIFYNEFLSNLVARP